MAEKSYVTLRNTISETEGKAEALSAAFAQASGGFLSNLRDYDIQRKHQTDFMAQECSKDWTNICDVYLSNLPSNEANLFLGNTARRKYCMMPNHSGNFCEWTCDPLNPTYPWSPEVCSWKGGQQISMHDDCDGNSYTRQLSCQDAMICDFPPDINSFKSDPVIQRCLTLGLCQDFFSQLRYVSDELQYFRLEEEKTLELV